MKPNIQTVELLRGGDSIFETRSDETTGDLWSAVGSIGSTALGMLPGLFGGGSSSGQARTVAQITAFGQQVNLTLSRILEQMNLGLISPQTAASEAIRVEALLSNSQLVNQPNGGSDRQALDQAKAAARSMVSQIQTAAAAKVAAGNGTNADPTTGQVLASPFGDKNILVGLAVAGAAALLLLKD